MKDALCQCVTQYIPFIHTPLIANVCCSESLSSRHLVFATRISTGSSQGFLLDITLILLLPCVLDILHLWDLQDQPLHVLQQFIEEVDAGVGQFKALDPGLPPLLHPYHQGEVSLDAYPMPPARGRASSPALMTSGLARQMPSLLWYPGEANQYHQFYTS